MAILIKQPEADPAVTACDGYVAQLALIPDTWANIRAGTVGMGVKMANTADATAKIVIAGNGATNEWTQFQRGIFCFDTSSLTAGAVVTGVTLNVYVESKPASLVAGDGLSLTQTTPAAYNTLVDVDYTEFTDTKLATDIGYAAVTVPAYNAFTFNAAGIAWINKVGVTAIGIRETLDVDNSMPATDTSLEYTIWTADAPVANPPLLTVTYTLSGSATPYYIVKQFRTTAIVCGEEPFDL